MLSHSLRAPSSRPRVSTFSASAIWKAAELIAAELADGKTQTQLAKEIGKSQNHVSIMNRVWALYNQVVERPPFAEAYAEAKKSETARDAEQRERARLTGCAP